MNYRLLSSLVLSLVTVAVHPNLAANQVRAFGPGTGPRIVFTTPESENRSAIEQLDRLADAFSRSAPPVAVSLIVTEGDASALPEAVRTGWPEGTNEAISALEEAESQAVFLVLPEGPARLRSGSSKVILYPGAGRQTTPRWMLQRSIDAFSSRGIACDLAESRLILYRIGWKTGPELLGVWLDAGIPAIALEASGDVTSALVELAASFRSGIPAANDRHYLVNRVGSRYLFIGETMMAIVLMAATAVFLFVIFILSFLIGKKSEQHLRDLFHVWWLPFAYLLINLAALYAGQGLVSALLSFRFGHSLAWEILPLISLGSKFLLAWFFMSVFSSFGQLMRFPEDSFIYGYIASISCLLNVFVFLSLDFSLCVPFLAVYLVSFAAYHFRPPALQALFILILCAPFVPYVANLAGRNREAIGQLYTGAGFWNLRLALFLMPFQLMISRLSHSLGRFGRKGRFYLPVSLFVSCAAGFVCIALLLFVPGWSETRPLSVALRQTIDESGSRLETATPVRLRKLEIAGDPESAPRTEGTPRPAPESFIGVRTSSRAFIERQLVTVTIEPTIPVQKIELDVESENGMSVYDASLPFEQHDAGRLSRFVSPENPAQPYTVSFSSDRNSVLSATVRAWTRSNPWGIRILDPGIDTDFLLEIERSVPFPLPGASGIPGTGVQ